MSGIEKECLKLRGDQVGKPRKRSHKCSNK